MEESADGVDGCKRFAGVQFPFRIEHVELLADAAVRVAGNGNSHGKSLKGGPAEGFRLRSQRQNEAGDGEDLLQVVAVSRESHSIVEPRLVEPAPDLVGIRLLFRVDASDDQGVKIWDITKPLQNDGEILMAFEAGDPAGKRDEAFADGFRKLLGKVGPPGLSRAEAERIGVGIHTARNHPHPFLRRIRVVGPDVVTDGF